MQFKLERVNILGLPTHTCAHGRASTHAHTCACTSIHRCVQYTYRQTELLSKVNITTMLDMTNYHHLVLLIIIHTMS